MLIHLLLVPMMLDHGRRRLSAISMAPITEPLMLRSGTEADADSIPRIGMSSRVVYRERWKTHSLQFIILGRTR